MLGMTVFESSALSAYSYISLQPPLACISLMNLLLLKFYVKKITR